MSAEPTNPLTSTVLVTTFRRPGALAACLDGVRGQTHAPDEVLVVHHESDDGAARLIAELRCSWPRLRSTVVSQRGSVVALNHGLAAARHDIVAIVDDDAIPAPDWLERILGVYRSDHRIAGVGGRDIVIEQGLVATASIRRRPWSGADPLVVGRVSWFGRMLANHHIGVGPPRDVDVLKGANMSLRRAFVVDLGYDERLRGSGAVVHTELSVCLPLRRRGLRMVYDPTILVHHYPAPRPSGDERRSIGIIEAAAHNEALQILDYLTPSGRLAFALWSTVVGTTEAPGAVVTVRDLIARRPAVLARLGAAQRGRLAAWRTRRERRAVPRELSP